MSLETPLCDALDIEYPIVQAPIGSATCPELAAAVSNAGGLGHLAVTWRDREDTRRVVRETRSLTDDPFAVNLVLDDATTVVDTDEHLATVLDAGAEIVTQGFEAGGHVQSEVATTALVPRVADVVGDDVPIVAAGGIGDGRGIAAALALGADGAWLGTRFVATEEARVHDEYQRRLRESAETDTEYTTLFDKGWPGTPHRVLRNETIERWERSGRPSARERPGEEDTVATTEAGERIERYDEALATPAVDGDIEAMALFAGQSVGLTDDVRPAGALVDDLVSETRAAISGLPGRTNGGG